MYEFPEVPFPRILMERSGYLLQVHIKKGTDHRPISLSAKLITKWHDFDQVKPEHFQLRPVLLLHQFLEDLQQFPEHFVFLHPFQTDQADIVSDILVRMDHVCPASAFPLGKFTFKDRYK